jgi:hypothetical protein
MAIRLEATYSKKLGLPGYSSHQYSVTITTELSDVRQVEAESTRLYALLQGCVDRDIQQTGFLPVNGSNGLQQHASNGHSQNGSNGHTNGHHANGRSNGQNEAWSCSEKQKGLILKIVEDHHVDKASIEALANERFGKGVRQLNRMEASGLIEELLEVHGSKSGKDRSTGTRFQKGRAA